MVSTEPAGPVPLADPEPPPEEVLLGDGLGGLFDGEGEGDAEGEGDGDGDGNASCLAGVFPQPATKPAIRTITESLVRTVDLPGVEACGH